MLPLLTLFRQLRAHGLPLGIDDYLAVLRAWQAGFGLNSRGALLDLCRLVWSKSEADSRLIELLFDSLFPPHVHRSETSEGDEPLPAPPLDSAPFQSLQETDSDPVISQISSQMTTGTGATAAADTLPSATFRVTATPDVGEPGQIVQAVRQVEEQAAGVADDLGRGRFNLLGDYFPITRRQMKQSWRHLRRPVREGPPEELDLRATIAKIGREGILYEPVLIPRRRNQARLLLLVDQNGSMAPFHSLTRQLVDTASHGGRLQQTTVYYFHDYPAHNLYRDPAQTEPLATAAVLTALPERTMVMIVSDAGAARGRFEQHRVETTVAFLSDLQASVRRLVWLNPLPAARWQDSSAAAIAAQAPMFSMSRAGLDAAINVLRGYRAQPVGVEGV